MAPPGVVDVVAELRSYGVVVDVHDPWVAPAYAEAEHGLTPLAEPAAGTYDAMILAVPHTQFIALGSAGIRALGKPGAVLFDVKAALAEADARL